MTKQTKRLMLFVVPLMVFIGLVVMFFFRLGKSTDIIPSRLLNQQLPAYELPLLSDTTRTMTKADLPKVPFLLNVWGSWCPTCKIEHPYLLKLHEQGVPMIGVNYKDELSDALSYLNTYKDPFLYSLQDLDGKYAIDLGLTGAPESFIIGTDGVVYQHIVGEINDTNWQAKIQPCLTALANQSLDTSAKQAACQQGE
ncbi:MULTISPECIES: DsbE family thiol:disulfide interchange protein [Moraxella]|uniref:DsbE family thiol:disulfide interchange protein n=1 Tax=Moraxella nasicaprae TaxID=2904122 RepID=A0ABY6F4U8_9GAMM|nr:MULTISPECIES: DsbE family thiol:disulfide interchange protein [Moraxella]MDO4895334.1 DsbE family thiol:disulfide interchange protein [Moraxella sp.]UXZ05116.1 DsbE family thiol:disulfide interchange protein [Moraxella nasicaprae]